MKTVRLMIVLGAVAALAVGCSGLAERATEEVVERAAEEAGGGDVDVDVGESEFDVKVENSEGSFEMGSGAELPDGFPEGFPLPDEYSIVNAVRSNDDTGTSFNVTFTTPTPGPDVASFYEQALADAGYEIVNTSNTDAGDGDTVSNFGFTGDEFDGTVTVFGSSEETTVGITLGPAAGN